MKMTGSTILITGGGTGIGRGLAERFHALGNTVIIAGRRAQVLEDVVAANPGMRAMTLDQSDPADIRRFAGELTAAHPTLDVLVNNAGVQRLEVLAQGDLAAAEETVAINLLGPIRLTAALLPALMARPAAAILNLSSGLAFVPMAMVPTYCATKAAIHAYTQSLRRQLKDTAVEVIEIVPPAVQTDLQGGRPTPHAMPLDAYIAETMALLANGPSAEIVVERVEMFRNAEREGRFDAVFAQLNAGRPPSTVQD